MNRRSIVAALIMLAVASVVAVSSGAAVKPHAPAWQLAGHGGFAFGFGSAWIAGNGTVLRVNPRTNRVTAKITNVGTWPIATATGIWTDEGFALDRIDPARNKVVTRIPLPSGGSLTFGFGSLWVATQDGNLLRVDPNAKKVVATIPIEASTNWALQIAAGADGVFVASADQHQVLKIDPDTNTVTWTAKNVGSDDSLLTVGNSYGAVWAHENAGAQGRGLLFRLDPVTGAVVSKLITSKASGGQYGGTDIAFGAGSIWTANANGTVSRITPDGSKVLSSIRTPFGTEFLSVGLGGIWIQSDSGNAARLPLARFGG